MKAILYLIIATVFLGLNFHLAKVILKEVNFIEAGFWRFLFGVVILTLLGSKKLPSFKIIKKNLKGISLTGFIGLFGFNLFFFLGLLNTSAVNAALIVSLNPALTILFSYKIIKTPINKIQIAGIIIAFFGVIYLILKGHITNISNIQFNYGDILILIANVFFALHHVWVKKYTSTISNLNFTLLTSSCCLIGFFILLPISGMEVVTAHTHHFWMAVLGIGCLGTALAYFLWQKGVQIKGAGKAGIYMNIIPLSAALFAILFDENIDTYHTIGGLFIITGLLISNNSSSKFSKTLS
ncbi:DMT family transporter [Flavivirga abyssicola]|uniref:DMT family transporter n=1 Tax=Flavivirga abyssicola TaxID=3063533 RepID=UPI0026E05AD9|nr:DMT family transporter [Flavivirga sp. MEBiC07777]WVK14885.1 DMT family transporter [Flavivirga sp. MEBiC07777]